MGSNGSPLVDQTSQNLWAGIGATLHRNAKGSNDAVSGLRCIFCLFFNEGSANVSSSVLDKDVT